MSEGVKRILVIDDEESMRLSLKEVLELETSHAVSVAASSNEAIHALKQRKFDLVISDVHMPDASGQDILQHIIDRNLSIPVILMTGQPDVKCAVDCIKMGAYDYLMKPFDAIELSGIVEDALRKKPATRVGGSLADRIVAGELREIGGYSIVSKIGAGNKGVVFLVEKEVNSAVRKFALKIIKIASSGDDNRDVALQRFFQEAQAAATVRHPNIVQIVDYSISEDDDLPFLVMEYVSGRSLHDLIRDRVRIEFRNKLSIIRQIADALANIHQIPIYHRDIKPGNIMIDDQWGVKIMDFGIARLPDSNLTLTTDLIGTPNYLAPEAFLSSRIDHRSDIYSLGVLAYELFVGKRPFRAKSLAELQQVVHERRPVKPRRYMPDIPVALDRMIMKMLSKSPDKRIQNASEIVKRLDRLMS